MTSLRQLEANRENAQRSSGPRTDQGKRVSRRNALRHGLAAETVIDILEDTDDYKAFEATIIADYDARTAVERELVLRLASLLWRIRRATAIETDLLRIQAEILRERTQASTQGEAAGSKADEDIEPSRPNPLARALRAVIPPRRTCTGNGHGDEVQTANGDADHSLDDRNIFSPIDCVAENVVNPTRTLTYCFLRLVNLDNRAFKRLNRYEAALWRQAVQTMVVLRTIRYRYS
jgi:hypothetical protein